MIICRTLVTTIRQFQRMSSTISQFKVKGLLAPTVNPYKSNGDLDLDKIPAYVDHLLEYGVPNVFVTGTVGEGQNLTLSERKQVAEAWVKHGKGRLSAVILQIGTGNLKESQELASHAQEIGADAISCVGPTYFKPRTLDDYVEYMRQVAAAAPQLPFYLYDIDFITGIPFSACDFMRAARDKMPTLRGLKHTTPNFVSMQTIIQDHGDHFQILLGSDELYLAALAIGVETSVISSFFGKVMNRIKTAFDKGDLVTARLEQERVLTLCRIRSKYGLFGPSNIQAPMKALFAMDLGQPRCPGTPYSNDILPKLKQDFTDAGFFNWGTQ